MPFFHFFWEKSNLTPRKTLDGLREPWWLEELRSNQVFFLELILIFYFQNGFYLLTFRQKKFFLLSFTSFAKNNQRIYIFFVFLSIKLSKKFLFVGAKILFRSLEAFFPVSYLSL